MQHYTALPTNETKISSKPEAYTKRARTVETGVFHKTTLCNIHLLSECFPVWLPLLESLSTSLVITLLDCVSEAGLLSKVAQNHQSTKLLDFLLTRMGTKRLQNSTAIHPLCVEANPVLLVSGSLEYVINICDQYRKATLPVICVVDGHFRGRLRGGIPSHVYSVVLNHVKWKKVRHSSVGGATLYSSLFAIIGLDSLSPTVSALQRTIVNFFDDNVRPTMIKSPSCYAKEHYQLNQLLVPGQYLRPIIHPTRWYCTGWGMRSCSLLELGLIHGFPRVSGAQVELTDLEHAPIQVLASILSPALVLLTPLRVEVNHFRTPETDSQPSSHRQKAVPGTWIPAIGKFLSHEWTAPQHEVTQNKKAKRDDAAVPSHLWDARLLLLYPNANIEHLECIRVFLMRYIWRTTYLEFINYLDVTFSTDNDRWGDRLARIRRSRRTLKGGMDSKDVVESYVVKINNNKSVSNTSHLKDVIKNTLQVKDVLLNTSHKVVITSQVNDVSNKTSHDKDVSKQANQYHMGDEGENLNANNLVDCITDDQSVNSGMDYEYDCEFCTSRIDQNQDRNSLPATHDAHDEGVTSDSSNESQSSWDSADTNNTITISNLNSDVLLKEAMLGCIVLHKLCHATWWDWSLGSALVFWRWNAAYHNTARYGMAPFICSDLPNWKRPARKPSKEKYDLVLSKLTTMVDRGYIEPGYVVSLTDYFDVPKGEDIRMVYNGSSCGLNAALWAPNFWLTFPRSASRLLDYGYYSVDMDLGEMFSNFPLHESLQEYSGVDLTPFKQVLFKSQRKQSTWFRWTRNWMGARSSPYSSVRFYYLMEEFARGNRRDRLNKLRWDIIKLNLPGSSTYDPSKPRVMKWDEELRRIVNDIITFVDDGRLTGQTREDVWAAARQILSRIQYLGAQEAARKRLPPTQKPGPWAGAIFSSTEKEVTRTVSVEKWLKGRKLVNALLERISGDKWFDELLDYKELEIIRGYLGHLSMTFEILVPYLKGFHLTLAAHLNKRDAEGWKMTDQNWVSHVKEQLTLGLISLEDAKEMLGSKEYSPHDHPSKVKPLTQLRDDVYALHQFFQIDLPPIIQERCAKVQVVRYGFGDASGKGFGSTIQTSTGLKYRIGVWGSDDESESSNFKELENVVATIEDEAAEGNLTESVLFFFTDNSTVESALFKGNSKSKKLFELVVRFRKLQFQYGTQVIVSHVSGKRMIAQGTDGVSRGNLLEGVGSGVDIMSYIPLHLSALERHAPLREWMVSWMGDGVEFLEPSDWFERGHDHHGGSVDKKEFWQLTFKAGIFVWSPPPAAAEVALDELRKAVIKRQMSTHVFICPRLMGSEWRKQLYKAADVVIHISPGLVSGWPKGMFEPLTVGFIFPLLPFKPWQRRGTPQMFSLARQLSGKHEQATDGPEDVDRIVSESWGSTRGLVSDFKHARDGDHLMVPFECDFCVYRKVKGYEVPRVIVLPSDKLFLATIRRAILDSFWSRATSTVRNNRDKVRLSLELSAKMGLVGPYQQSIYLPNRDHCGYEVACQMLLASQRPGRYSDSHSQWDTIRKVRTAYSNFIRASSQENAQTLAFSDDKGMAQRLVTDECSSVWFARFWVGCRRRMGQDWRPNKGASPELILEIINKVNDKVVSAESDQDVNTWSTFGTYVVISYVLSLRGSEGLLLDIQGLRKYREKWGKEGNIAFIILVLSGTLKNFQNQDRCHLFPCVSVTESDIRVEFWLVRLLEAKEAAGVLSGPLISDNLGRVKTTRQLDELLVEILSEIHEESSHLFPSQILTQEDISNHYSVFRTLRRSSATRATEKNVSISDINCVNRWEVTERAQGNKPNAPMRQHYVQTELLLKPFLRYTGAM